MVEMDGAVWSATAQLGWIVGPVVLVGLSYLTYYTSTLLANCYMFLDAINRMIINHSYIDAVRSYLGPRKMFIHRWVQYVSLWATLVSYTITVGTSAMNHVSATAHIVSPLMGSGVLALAWTCGQLGWIVGTVVLVGLSYLTYYTSILLANCYRFFDVINETIINRSYIDVVRSYLGPRKMFICGWARYVSLWATLVGYIIAAYISAIAVSRANSFHRHGHGARCDASGNIYIYMVAFGVFRLILSQFSSLKNITWLSVMAVAYYFITLGLCMLNGETLERH